MFTTYHGIRKLGAAATLAAALLAAGCTVSSSEPPPLSGPSGFALSIGLSASPDILPADGRSVSVIRVTVRDAAGKGLVGQRLVLAASNGVLSQGEVTTNGNGEALVEFTAPPTSVTSDRVTITATPIGSNADNLVPEVVSIALTGVVVPTASFTASTTTPGLNSLVTFDASGSRVNGAPCLQCTFAWDFGDGASAQGITTSHRFTTRGSVVVRLTVTGPTGSTATTSTTLIVGEPEELTPVITFSPTDPVVGDQVNFDASESRTPDGAAISTYTWDFGDGTPRESGVRVAHPFADARTYVVRLTIVDELGRSGTTTISLTIDEP
jgi:PKD repeat protein